MGRVGAGEAPGEKRRVDSMRALKNSKSSNGGLFPATEHTALRKRPAQKSLHRATYTYQERGEDPGSTEGRGHGSMEGGPLEVVLRFRVSYIGGLRVNRTRTWLSQPRLQHSVRSTLGET